MKFLEKSDSFKIYVNFLNIVTELIPSIKERFQSLHAKIFFLYFLFLLSIYLMRKFVIGRIEEKIYYILTCRPCRSKKFKKDFQLTDDYLFLSQDFYQELSIP